MGSSPRTDPGAEYADRRDCLTGREQEITDLNVQISDRDQQIQELNEQMENRDQQIQEFDAKIKDDASTALIKEEEMEIEKRALQEQIEDLNSQIEECKIEREEEVQKVTNE